MADSSSPAKLDTVAREGRLLSLIADTAGLLEINEFRHELLHALRGAVPADWVALNDIGPDPETITAIIDPPAPVKLFEKFKQYSHQNPLIERYARTRDGRALRFSDVVTPAQLHALDLYTQVYRPMGIEHQIAFTLPHAADRILGVVLARRDSDFTDADRDLLDQVRPFLSQAYRNAVRYSALLSDRQTSRATQRAPELERLVRLGLTRRQAQVLQLLATGASERDIATRLQISPRTVYKHLQRTYRQLAVTNRSHAAAIAWATLDTALPPAPPPTTATPPRARQSLPPD